MTEQVGQDRSRSSSSELRSTPAKSMFSKRGLTVTVIRTAIILGFFLAWELASGRWIEPFLISSPSRILCLY